ncbi:GNAT superfamily N-acetyltransferase [Allocatelliglobosispora scoriae]|uniref:GNAT superfamily N-acetyltransferase n=1 Tax=Allocatelliglobosispora scoriae TaxID=643052 RepID=A0A841BL10_9ACTN|nr:GNAT superfamily N-acetyltransferase [Allocatelliglobosispora scoriae]
MTAPHHSVLEVRAADATLDDEIGGRLVAFNEAAVGADQHSIAIRVTDSDGGLAAGLTGWSWGDCAGIGSLWVREDHRSHGWGGRLLQAAEDEARRRGCRQITVSSLTFQAPGFYRKHGYVEVGRLDAFPDGNADHHFVKSLVEPADAEPVRLMALVEYAEDAVDAGTGYEDTVLGLLGRHGGTAERRMRTADSRTELHVILFSSRDGYEAFLVDPARLALRAELGDAAPDRPGPRNVGRLDRSPEPVARRVGVGTPVILLRRDDELVDRELAGPVGVQPLERRVDRRVSRAEGPLQRVELGGP